MRYGNNVLKLC